MSRNLVLTCSNQTLPTSMIWTYMKYIEIWEPWDLENVNPQHARAILFKGMGSLNISILASLQRYTRLLPEENTGATTRPANSQQQDSLDGGIPTHLKNMKVSWDDFSQHMETCNMSQTTNQFFHFPILWLQPSGKNMKQMIKWVSKHWVWPQVTAIFMESKKVAMELGLTYFCILGTDGLEATPSLLTCLFMIWLMVATPLKHII